MLIRLLNANDLIGCDGGSLADEINSRGAQKCKEVQRGA